MTAAALSRACGANLLLNVAPVPDTIVRLDVEPFPAKP